MRITPKPDAITQACKDLNISRDELARRMRVSTVTAYRVHDRRVDPSPKFIAELMKITGKRFEDLFDLVEDAA